MTTTITFKYLNHSGKIAERRIDVEAIEFIRTINFGYQPGWFITGRCHDKDARRSFALSRIIFEDGDDRKIIPLVKL